MDDFERLRYVTERYAHLKGLRLVPLGISFLASAAWRDGQLRRGPGTAAACIGISGGHPRTHYLALAAVCLIFATLGTSGVPIHARDVLLDDLIGIGLIVVGIGDHLLLRRTLEPVTHVETV